MKLIDQLIEAVERRREATAEVRRITDAIHKLADGRSNRRKPRKKRVAVKKE